MSKTIFEQTGWTGLTNKTICQDNDVLLKITEYDYDLKDPEFYKYCQSRIGFEPAKTTATFEWLANHHILTVDACLKIWRGKLQDCWEIFTNRR